MKSGKNEEHRRVSQGLRSNKCDRCATASSLSNNRYTCKHIPRYLDTHGSRFACEGFIVTRLVSRTNRTDKSYRVDRDRDKCCKHDYSHEPPHEKTTPFRFRSTCSSKFPTAFTPAPSPRGAGAFSHNQSGLDEASSDQHRGTQGGEVGTETVQGTTRRKAT